MRKDYFKIACLFLFISFTSCNSEDSFTFFNYPVACTTANTFVGDVYLQSQSEVDDFVQNNYCSIQGDLIIGSMSGFYTDISDLTGFSSLSMITGRIEIEQNEFLQNLNGLENIVEIGSRLTIDGNPALTTMDALNNNIRIGGSISVLSNRALVSMGNFPNVTTLNYLTIIDNPLIQNLNAFSALETVNNSVQVTANHSLTSMQGLGNLTIVEEQLWIGINNSLRSLSGLNSLSEVRTGRFWVYQNPILQNLSGLENVDTIALLHISRNLNMTSLTGIEGLSNLTVGLDIQENNALTFLVNFDNLKLGENTETNGIAIRNNANLTTLSGLESIQDFTGLLTIYENSSLRNFCDLQTILINGTIGIVRIDTNFFNPSQTDIENGINCSI